MKHFSFLLLLPTLFLSPNLFSQKNTIALDVRILPACDIVVAGGSLNYYRLAGPSRMLGLKATWNTDALGLEDWETRTHVVNMDLVNRWNLSRNDKVRWFVEAGVSGLVLMEHLPKQEKIWLDCTVGMTDEKITELVNYQKNGHTETQFMLGFATATSLEFRISSHFSLGAVLMANLYYSPEDKCICPYLNPGLRTAFSF